MKVNKYKLIEAFSPSIENNTVIEDNGLNGELIVYSHKTGHNLMTLFGHDINLFDPRSSKTVLFFRPYKTSWDNEKIPLKPNEWGKKAHPLTNLIIEVEGDLATAQKELKKGTIKSLRFVKDTVLSKKIRAKEKSFVIKTK